MGNLHRKNHYISQGYLKRWGSNSNRKIWVYRILVSNENVPEWKKSSIKSVAYHSYLYTRIISGGESDDIEKWFDTEFEHPAEASIQKMVLNRKLKPADWHIIIRFLAAQDVRTPARLIENLERWKKTLPEILENTLKESVRKLEQERIGSVDFKFNNTSLATNFPISIKTETEPDKKKGRLKVETVPGRGMWLFAIQHLLSNTASILLKHKWTVLSPPSGVKWLTSDDPVIRLNFHTHKKYDFLGGWGSEGTELLWPISPKHLLYTQIGKRPPLRGTTVNYEFAQMINRFIVEHAHRMVFSFEPDPLVAEYRPKTVDSEQFKFEKHQWAKWHETQTKAEQELLSGQK